MNGLHQKVHYFTDPGDLPLFVFVLFSIAFAAGSSESGGCLQRSADKVSADGERDYANKGEGSGEEGSRLLCGC